MFIVVFGPPGCGKGTQSKLVSHEYGIPQIETGQIFREHIRQKTKLGKEIEALYHSGELVPDSITEKIIKELLSKQQFKNGAVFDGVPRTLHQGKFLENFLESFGNKISIAIYLDVKKSEILKRVKKRFLIEKRGEDVPHIQEMRFKIFEERTKPLLSFFSKRKILFKVDGNRPVEEIFKSIKDILDKKVVKK